MGRQERIQERLEIRPPPLRQTIPDFPVQITLLWIRGRKPLIQPVLEALDLFVAGEEVVAGELEEGVGDLQHQDVWVVVLVADEDGFAGAAHAVVGVVILETLQAGEDRRVFFRLGLFGAECVVG